MTYEFGVLREHITAHDGQEGTRATTNAVEQSLTRERKDVFYAALRRPACAFGALPPARLCSISTACRSCGVNELTSF